MRHVGLASLILSLALASGCHVDCCSRHVSEKHRPPGIRKTHCSCCYREESLYRFPRGPNAAFFGHNPAYWREWPTSASRWHDIYCGPLLPPLGPGIVPAVPVMVPVDRQAVLWPTDTQAAQSDRRLPPGEQSETPAVGEPAPQAASEISVQFDRSKHQPNELPQSIALASEMPPAKSDDRETADHPATPPEPASSPPLKTWRALRKRDKPSGLKFQRWPAVEATTVPPAKALANNDWVVMEQSETAARQASASIATVIAGAASEHASDAMPADHDRPQVIIEDSVQDSWRKFEPRSTEAAPVISAPELPSEKPSIQAKTSAALQRLMTHETEDAAAE